MIRLLAAATALVAACVLGVSAGAAPLPGATYQTFSLTYPGAGAVYFSGLGGCDFVAPNPYATNGNWGLQVSVKGWVLTLDSMHDQVDFHAHVAGTVLDAYGNAFNVSGNFDQSGTRVGFPPNPFTGAGTLTLAGPHGVITGEAELRTNNGPEDVRFWFTHIRQCHLRSGG